MNYYAPFYAPVANYSPNSQNGLTGQNLPPQAFGGHQNVAQMPQSDSSMIWVLGKNEAESYPVAPNCQVVLWDKNAPTLYVKSMSANGIPNMRILDFTERSEIAQNSPVSGERSSNTKYVVIDDFNALRSEFEELRTKYKEFELRTEEKTKGGTKKTKGSEEL